MGLLRPGMWLGLLWSRVPRLGVWLCGIYPDMARVDEARDMDVTGGGKARDGE